VFLSSFGVSAPISSVNFPMIPRLYLKVLFYASGGYSSLLQRVAAMARRPSGKVVAGWARREPATKSHTFIHNGGLQLGFTRIAYVPVLETPHDWGLWPER